MHLSSPGYSEEWRTEADKRGLWHLKTAPDAIPHLVSKKNLELFSKHGVLTESSLRAREDIMYHDYMETILLETTTLLEMMYTGVIPALIGDINQGKTVRVPFFVGTLCMALDSNLIVVFGVCPAGQLWIQGSGRLCEQQGQAVGRHP